MVEEIFSLVSLHSRLRSSASWSDVDGQNSLFSLCFKVSHVYLVGQQKLLHLVATLKKLRYSLIDFLLFPTCRGQLGRCHHPEGVYVLELHPRSVGFKVSPKVLDEMARLNPTLNNI